MYVRQMRLAAGFRSGPAEKDYGGRTWNLQGKIPRTALMVNVSVTQHILQHVQDKCEYLWSYQQVEKRAAGYTAL